MPAYGIKFPTSIKDAIRSWGIPSDVSLSFYLRVADDLEHQYAAGKVSRVGDSLEHQIRVEGSEDECFTFVLRMRLFDECFHIEQCDCLKTVKGKIVEVKKSR